MAARAGWVLLVAALALAPAHADEDERGERPAGLAPLAHLLAHIHGNYPGEVLKVELERERLGDLRVWIYEIKLLTPEGDVLKLSYDARSLELLRSRGHGKHDKERDADGREHQDGED